MQRPGGNKRPENHQEDLGYVNRFLASCSFVPGNWKTVTPDAVKFHDQLLHQHYEAGTVSRILQTLLDFWKWCTTRGWISWLHSQQVEEYIQGCLRATRKDVRNRNTERRVDEDQALPRPQVLEQFKESTYVAEVKSLFLKNPLVYMYEMACCLLVLCSFYNAPRASVLKNIRLKDIDHATTEDDELYTITIGKHKTSHTGKAAFVTVNKELMALLRKYRKTVTEKVLYLDSTAPLFRTKVNTPLDSDDVNRMAKRAWKKAGMTAPFNLTINRKLTTVTGRKADPTMSGPIARQLCHNVSTADQYYAVHDDRRAASNVYRHLQSSFRQASDTATTQTSTRDQSEKTADENGNPASLESSHQRSDDAEVRDTDGADAADGSQLRSGDCSQTNSEADDDYVPPSPKPEPPRLMEARVILRAIDATKPRKPRVLLDAGTRAQIRDAYAEIILEFSSSCRTIPFTVVRTFRKGRWPDLSDLQLRDIVRNMIIRERKRLGQN